MKFSIQLFLILVFVCVNSFGFAQESDFLSEEARALEKMLRQKEALVLSLDKELSIVKDLLSTTESLLRREEFSDEMSQYLEQKDNLISLLQDENKKILKDLDELFELNQSLLDQKNSYIAESNEFRLKSNQRDDVSDLKARYNILKQENERLRNQLTKGLYHQETLEGQVDELTRIIKKNDMAKVEIIDDIKKPLYKRIDDLMILNEEFRQKEQAHLEKLAQIREPLIEKIDDLRTRLHTAESDLKYKSSELGAINTQENKYLAELDEEKKKNVGLRQRIDQLVFESQKQSKNEVLPQQLSQMQIKFQDELSAMEKILQEKEMRIIQLTQAHEDFIAQNQMLKTQVGESKSLKSEISKLSKELKFALEKIEQKEKDIASISIEQEEKINEFQILQEEHVELKRNFDEISSRETRMQDIVSTKVNRLKKPLENKVSKLENEIEIINSQLSEKDELVKKTDKALKEIINQKNELQDELVKLKDEYESINKRFSLLEEKRGVEIKKISEYNKQLSNNSEIFEKLKKEIEAVKGELVAE